MIQCVSLGALIVLPAVVSTVTHCCPTIHILYFRKPFQSYPSRSPSAVCSFPLSSQTEIWRACHIFKRQLPHHMLA
jgi:hypothetical protein